MTSRAVQVCVLALASLVNLAAAEVPVPRVEVGSHTGFIKKLSASADGRFILTASEDKTARLWDAQSGRLLRVLRVPIADGHEGKLYAGALSPDGTTAALGGFLGLQGTGSASVYFFSTTNGRLSRTVSQLPPYAVDNIVFSADGRVLALCFADAAGIMLFDWSSKQFIRSDRSATDKILGAAFAVNGDFAITTLNGSLFIYTAASRYEKVLTRQLIEGRRPMHVQYSPDGSALVVGFDGEPRFIVLDSRDLKVVSDVRLPSAARQKGLHVVDWSFDGGSIFAGGEGMPGGPASIFRWSKPFDSNPALVLSSSQRISDIRRLPDGAMTFSSGEPEVGIVNPDGRIRWRLRGSVLNMTTASAELRTSKSGEVVELVGKSSALPRTQVQVLAAVESVMKRARDPMPGVSATSRAPDQWNLVSEPESGQLAFNGRSHTLFPHERLVVTASPPSLSYLLVCTAWNLRRYDTGERNKEWRSALPAECENLALSGDGELAIASLADGTLRWYRVDDGVEILSMFIHRNGEDWIAWIPTGYYMSSLAGDNYIGWHVNRGNDKGPDFYRAVQFERLLYRPDIVQDYFRAHGRTAAAPSGGFEIAQLESIAPPRLYLALSESTRDRGSGSVTIEVSGESQSLPMQDWVLFVNGVPSTPASARSLAGHESRAFTRRITVDLPAKTNRIRVESSNGRSLGFAELDVDTSQALASPKGDLYVAAVGVSAFADKDVPKLQYASKDAAEIVHAFTNESIASGFRAVKTWVREDSATPATGGALEGLPEFLASASGNDTVIVFLASHGISDPKGNYYFVPKDAAKADIDRALKGGSAPSLVRWDFFVNALSRAAGRRLLIVDTCASGAIDTGFDVHSLAKRSMSSSFALITASKGDELSQEYAAGGHGLFTYGLLDALEKGFDPNADGKVSLSEAFEHAFDTVQTLRNRARGTQTPQMVAPNVLADMQLSRAQTARKAGTRFVVPAVHACAACREPVIARR